MKYNIMKSESINIDFFKLSTIIEVMAKAEAAAYGHVDFDQRRYVASYRNTGQNFLNEIVSDRLKVTDLNFNDLDGVTFIDMARELGYPSTPNTKNYEYHKFIVHGDSELCANFAVSLQEINKWGASRGDAFQVST